MSALGRQTTANGYSLPRSWDQEGCYILALGALKECTLPLSTPAMGSSWMLMTVGLLWLKAIRHAAAREPELFTSYALPPKASIIMWYLQQ